VTKRRARCIHGDAPEMDALAFDPRTRRVWCPAVRVANEKRRFSRKTSDVWDATSRDAASRKATHLEREEIRQRLVHAYARDQTSELHGRGHDASCARVANARVRTAIFDRLR
jgi:hypothetical protein